MRGNNPNQAFVDDIPALNKAGHGMNSTQDQRRTFWPPELRELLDALKYLYTLRDGWDGMGSEAPHPASLELAFAFLDLFPWPLKRAADTVSPVIGGCVAFKWYDDEGCIMLVIDKNSMDISRIDHAGNITDLGKADWLAGVKIPADIVQHIPARIRPV